MKKSIFYALALMAAVVSCDKLETENEEEKKNEPAVETVDTVFYSGTLVAEASSGTATTPDTRVSVNYTGKADSVSISIYQAKLAQRMPAMDIIIPNVTLTKNGGVDAITSASSVPLAMGAEFPGYTVTEFAGQIEGDSIRFSLKFGKTPTSFSGKRIQVAE